MPEALMRDNAAQLYRQARQHWSAGRKHEAELAYREAIAADPEYGYPHYDLAHLLESQESHASEAISHYRRFLELCADDPRLAQQVERARSRLDVLEPAAAAVETPSPVAPAARSCPHCQEAVAESAETCGHCGGRLAPSPAGEAPQASGLAALRQLPIWAIVLLCAAAAILVMSVVLAIVLLTRESGRQGRAPATPTTVVSRPLAKATAAVAPTSTVAPTATLAPTPLPSPTAQPAAETVSVAGPTASTPAGTPSAIPEEAGESQTAQSTPGASATEEPMQELSGRLAFAVFDAERSTYDIYIADTDGTGLQRLIEEASQPAFSPDGSRLAFRHWKADERGIEVIDVGDANPARLTTLLQDSLPSWSRDAQTLVFFSRRESVGSVRIYSVKTAGGPDWELKRGTEPVAGEYPSAMPNGSIIYRVSGSDPGLAIMNADGSGGSVILRDGSATAPSVSPDGTQVAFMSKMDGNWEIYRMGIDGTGLERLTTNASRDGLPAWSPDGRTIAFVSDRDEGWAVWAMTPEGWKRRKLFDLPGSPDGLVGSESDYSSRGWVEERLSWGP